MKLFNIFKKEQKKKSTRGFKGALKTRFTNWLFASFTKINVETKYEFKQLVLRVRDLSKNDEIFRSHLNNIEKSIIGKQGFRLQSLVKTPTGELDAAVNDELELAWYDFGKRSNGYITKCGGLGDRDLDALILRTLIIDGEVFIRIIKDAKNPYGISFKILDSLCIDFDKNRPQSNYENAIVAGIEIDKDNRPVNYYYKEGDTDNYSVGFTEVIPANEIIHIFKKEFVGQVRGFSEICASIDSLKQLDDYAIAELFAAKIAACQNVFYERTGSTAGDWMDQEEGDDKGEFLSAMSPGESSIVPKGYTVKSISPNHPNTNFSGFVKAIVRRIASSVGVSYNRLAHDYEAVNYSSLREASIDEGKTYANIQQFFVDNWKTFEYELFLKSYIMNGDTQLKPSKLKDYLNYNFICRKESLFDPAKEVVAIERRLKLGLSNPIIELESLGLDPEEVVQGWVRWNELLAANNISFNDNETVPLNVVDQFQDEVNHPENSEE